MTVETALLRLGFHRLAHEIGKACKLRLAFERQRECLLVRQHVLAKRGAECRQPFDDLGKAFFGRAIEPGTGATERDVVAFEHPLLFRIKPERLDLPHECIDAAEQVSVGADFVPVARGSRREVAFDLQKRLIAVSANQEMEDGVHAIKGFAASLQRGNSIFEIGPIGRSRNGGNLCLVRGERAVIGRSKVLRPDLRERRNLIRRRPIG